MVNFTLIYYIIYHSLQNCLVVYIFIECWNSIPIWAPSSVYWYIL